MNMPSVNSLNLALRFILELACLGGIGLASWQLASNSWRWVLVILVPLAAATAWGVFAVLDDPSRSGNAPIAVSGWIRLTIELVILGSGVAGYYLVGNLKIAATLTALLIVHYVLSYERIVWLLGR